MKKLGLALEEPDEYTELIGFSVPSDVIMTKREKNNDVNKDKQKCIKKPNGETKQ